MNNIYLLSPYYDDQSRFPESSLEYIRFYLTDNGYKVRLIDCADYDSEYDRVMEFLKEDKRPIIGITAYTRERFHAYRLIKRIRREIPDSLIVVGGHHFGFLPEECLKELPDVDIVVRGEGENTFKEICDSVYDNKGYQDISGISYKGENGIIHNSDRPIEMNLDKFRNFDINNLPSNGKTLLFPSKVDKKSHYFTVSASRGCPNRCVFCSLTSSKVRLRSIDSIIKEIEDKIRVTGVRNVSFNDSSLTHRKQFVADLCEKIIEKNLNIKWNCYSRVNIDTGILKLMKRSGLVSVEIGLESGSPRILRSVGKRINIEQFEKFCKEAHKVGIKTYIFCLISLPDEKLEDVDMTLSLIERLSPYIYRAGMQATRILPDAALYNIARERCILPEEFSWFKPYSDPYNISGTLYKSIPVYLEHLSSEDVKEKLDEFDKITKTCYSDMELIKMALRQNLKADVLKSLTVASLIRKISKAFTMLWGAYKSRGKHFKE